ncbi:histidine phosphatase family protein [Hymenobacter psychrotolerans]|uniref:Histidine phosphatase superfamily (Branch 1) n=1 Tax=Hymenobacter psychrotolerans DSM 18569 TaxID=1121959 RepID=A0A1M6SSW6_9BACT|nr:phosphoglycerate mutase family protein [Hymenobacter psychrotolerans]SHK47779.1 Histidine phosphatase superfamily (branch 1) [Hymenobacter psychrotolerans DSM 18569]
MTFAVLRRSAFLFLLPGVWLLAGSCSQPAQRAGLGQTVVYVVRHGEKDLTPGLTDPPLTPAGQQRAIALRTKILAQARPTVIFSTATTRTRATVQPLADERKLPLQTYDAKQPAALAARIRRDYQGQTAVVVGHSNTILEAVEALGAKRPVATVPDEQYGYLFRVTLPQDSTQAATVETQMY